MILQVNPEIAESISELESPEIRLLAYVASAMVVVLCSVVVVLWRKINKDKEEYKKDILDLVAKHDAEIKEERDYIKSEGKESARILNGLSSVLSDLAKGVERDLPRDIMEVKNIVDQKGEEIKNHITITKGNNGP